MVPGPSYQINCLSAPSRGGPMMAAMRILLAEDEHVLGEWLAKTLEQSGWRAA